MYVGLEELKSQLIGFGCDGINVNIAKGGLKGLLTKEFPWLVVIWCLSHRLELFLKDALKSTYFDVIDDLLLKLYYLYGNSPKKYQKSGSHPLRTSGSHFVAHKVNALERIIDRYGAYLGHLIALTEDSSVKGVDKQKIKVILSSGEKPRLC